MSSLGASFSLDCMFVLFNYYIRLFASARAYGYALIRLHRRNQDTVNDIDHSLADLVLAKDPGKATKGQVSVVISHLTKVDASSSTPGLDNLQSQVKIKVS